jgi:ketosteroid isomerase-like protein
VTAPARKPPGRAVLRLAGVFTQLACASCLLLGTIAFVLVQQNRTGGTGLAVAWGIASMAGLVFGGLMARGGLIAVLASAILDAAFGITLLALDSDTLHGVLPLLSASDVDMLGEVLFGIAIGMIWVSALCFASIPQAVRYGRWLRADLQPAGSTERAFPPPPVAAAAPGSMWRAPAAPPAETRSRRRMYFALAGFAIGFGAGIGVLVSSTSRSGARTPAITPPPTGSGSPTAVVSRPLPDAGTPEVKPDQPAGSPAGSPAGGIETLLQDQRASLARGDLAGVVASLAPDAVGFGIDADELAEGRDAILAQLRRDLGKLDGLTVEARFSQIGQDRNHAWIAQELILAGAGRKTQRFAVTQLAAAIDGKWKIVAWHWGLPVPDGDAERVALLGTKPVPRSVPNKLAGPKDLDAAVRAAFVSRRAFMESRSERDDAFNFGSGPGERMTGGSHIKRVFRKSKSEVRLHDGALVIGGGAWDPAQQAAPWIGFAALNVDMTLKTRAATDLTQTFRVLAILLKEGTEWKIVQAHFSHGGPIR